jgi:hypothetical protein
MLLIGAGTGHWAGAGAPIAIDPNGQDMALGPRRSCHVEKRQRPNQNQAIRGPRVEATPAPFDEDHREECKT